MMPLMGPEPAGTPVALAAPAHLRVEHHVDLIAAAVDHAADGAVEARIQYALRVEVGLVAVAVVNVDVGAAVEHEFALLERHIGVDVGVGKLRNVLLLLREVGGRSGVLVEDMLFGEAVSV